LDERLWREFSPPDIGPNTSILVEKSTRTVLPDRQYYCIKNFQLYFLMNILLYGRTLLDLGSMTIRQTVCNSTFTL